MKEDRFGTGMKQPFKFASQPPGKPANSTTGRTSTVPIRAPSNRVAISIAAYFSARLFRLDSPSSYLLPTIFSILKKIVINFEM